MDLGLAGRRAIVTGGSKGLGQAIAAELIGEGASVAICSRHADELEATADELMKQANAAYWAPTVRFLHTHLSPSYRVEAVDTVGHWPTVS